MNIDDKIFRAILDAHPDDLPLIKQYANWIRVRRIVNNIFYFETYWMKPAEIRVHWIGGRSA